MSGEVIEIFLHGVGRPKVVQGRIEETLRDLLARVNALPEQGCFVFIGESEDAIQDPDADEDVQAPADLTLSLEVLDLARRKHVHTSAHHRIEVVVHQNGEHKRKFAPATTIATVTAWAKKRFHIDPKDGADWVLVLRPGKEQPRPNEHLGELLKPGSHVLEFDLVREVSPQG